MIARLQRAIEEASVESLVLSFTLIWTLAFYETFASVLPFRLLVLVAAIPLAFRSTLRSASVWSALFLLRLATVLLLYPRVQNHNFLSLYWILACLISVKWAREALPDMARWLIGASFLCATFWKVYGGEFLDGGFLQHMFMSDAKFQDTLRLMTGMTFSDAKLMTSFHQTHFETMDGLTLPTNPIVVPPALHKTSVMLAWATVLVEGSVAFAFLLAKKAPWLGRYRDWVLLAFIVGAYPIFRVTAFGLLLCVMGFAQAENRARVFYLPAVIFIVVVNAIPWQIYLLR